MPQISVIVPVYNVEPYIHKCVDSILKQTFADFELILVDDGSPDNCGAICDEYAGQDSRVRVFHQKNGGPGAARNVGIDWAVSNSDSEWIAFVDSDDWVHPEYLAYLYRAVKENNVMVSVCDFMRARERNEPFDSVEYSSSIVSWEGYIFNVYLYNKLYKKELLYRLRFPVGKSYEDEFLTYKLISQCSKLAYISCDLYSYYYNAEGVSKKPLSLKRMDAVEAFKERIEYYRKRGDKHVLPRCLLKYLSYIYNFGRGLKSADGIPPEARKRCEKQLKRMMRRAMLRYMPMSLRQSFLQYYTYAYPVSFVVALNILRKIVISVVKALKMILKPTPINRTYRWLKHAKKRLALQRKNRVNSWHPIKCRLNRTEQRNRKVIVSLTSFPERIQYAHNAICSMLHQTYKPDKVILWLAEPQFPNREKDLPHKLRSLCKYGLTIRWVEKDIKSYKKLIPALREYPEDIIVTADDDLYWPKEHLAKLIRAMKERPNEIHCHLIKRIHFEYGLFDSIGRTPEMYGSSLYCNSLLGGAGTVYPPHCLDEEVFNEKVFMELAPTSDDIWFWAMALKKGTKIHWIEKPDEKLLYVEETQEKTPCLCRINNSGDRPFKKQLNAVIERYSLAHLIKR